MDFEGKTTTTATNNPEFASAVTTRKPLELLRDTEALLRRPAVATLVPILPPKLSHRIQKASTVADESWQKLAEINIEQISDWELQPARLQVGLSFVGFSALMILVLLLYLNTLHPELSAVEQIRRYWYHYVWFVCLGIAGMFILGRETMRPTVKPKKIKK
jgi:hypothetical protein